MIKLYSSALDQTIAVNRIIGTLKGKRKGPCLVFFGGIHGNEPSGVFALNRVVQEMQKNVLELRGSVYALAGNLRALEKSKRYSEEDLNRIWNTTRIQQIQNTPLETCLNEKLEQKELLEVLSLLFAEEKGPFYFFDLHTTSSKSIPFLTVNDSLLNRRFTARYPIPKILGIEEFLEGPLLSYLNELGYVSFGFESGQHDALASIENHEAFIYLSMLYCGVLERNQNTFAVFNKKLKSASSVHQGFFEIYFRYQIAKEEKFEMLPGFSNFQSIKKGEPLSISNDKQIYSEDKALIFMPLYQKQGEDGYFKIRKIPTLFLWLSKVFRKGKLDRILPFLPGVRWSSKSKDELIVNKRIAFLFARQLLHLMGYRNKTYDNTHLIVKNRESSSKTHEYKSEFWYGSDKYS